MIFEKKSHFICVRGKLLNLVFEASYEKVRSYFDVPCRASLSLTVFLEKGITFLLNH